MDLIGWIRPIRMLMALAVMVAFALVPLSAAANIEHACDEGGIVCNDLTTLDVAPDEAPDHEGHDHTAHHCGSCHVHLMGGAAVSIANSKELSGPGLMPLNESRQGSDPGGLYRPPRI
ncbi:MULTISPECIES: hypothetical protein [Henriciella]|uniref:hypothetical protein n=1 Tax=Henriciella TaxID=453849 RepID=UPI003513D7BC